MKIARCVVALALADTQQFPPAVFEAMAMASGISKDLFGLSVTPEGALVGFAGKAGAQLFGAA